MSGRLRSGGDRSAGIVPLLEGLVVTLLSVGMLLGGFLLSELDTSGIRPRPTQAIVASQPSPTPFLPVITPTLFPTASPSPPPLATETAISPTLTPSASPTQPISLRPSCPRPTGWTIYVVRQGDTLARLAWRAGVTTYALMQVNCLNTTTIYPGQQLYLPPTFYASPTPRSYHCGPPIGWRVYIVQPGDTLYSLSRRFNVGIETIRQANCLDSYVIYVGQALYLPPLPSTPTRQPTATPTPSPTPSPSPTTSPTPISPTPTPTEFPTFTPTPTPTFTALPSLTATPTPTGIFTYTPTYTPPPVETASPTPTPTFTPVPSATSTPTGSPTTTYTPVPSATSTPTQLPTSTYTPVPSATPLPTVPPTATYTPAAATSTPAS